MSNRLFETISSAEVKSPPNEKRRIDLKQIFRAKIRPISLLSKPLGQFRVLWKDLTYTVSQKSFGRKDRVILDGVSGYFDSHQITAIMGPSGCGKSSLLSCISGQKKKNLIGSITISTNIEVNQYKCCAITGLTIGHGLFSIRGRIEAGAKQQNAILDRITIRESLMYASLLKNPPGADHRAIVNGVQKKLMIENCANLWPKKCSGGELKRVMIGLELVSKPNILILDEPTTGLDFVTARQLVNILIELTKQSEPLAIVLTIHQPSAKIFNLFNIIYLLSHSGQCIYNGSPKTMLLFFSEYGVQCPQFTNPADFALDVAGKEYGAAKLLTLATVVKIKTMDWPDYEHHINPKHQFRTGRHIWYLTIRSLKTMVRDPFNLALKVFGYVFMSAFIGAIYGLNSGQLSGCRFELNSMMEAKNLDLFKHLSEMGADMFENIAAINFMALHGWFLGIFPVLLIFPKETDVFLKEYGNGYYSCFSYLMSKVLSDLPFTLLLPNMAAFILYYMTGQYSQDWWRSLQFAYIFVLISMNSSALGLLIGALLSQHPTAIAFLGMLSLVPINLLSGVMIRIHKTPLYFQWLSFGDFLRFATNGILINTYGFNRCEDSGNQIDILSMVTEEQLFSIYSNPKINSKALIKVFDWFTGDDIEAKKSIVLTEFQLNDSDYLFAICMLVLHLVAFRVLTYFTLVTKVNRNN